MHVLGSIWGPISRAEASFARFWAVLVAIRVAQFQSLTTYHLTLDCHGRNQKFRFCADATGSAFFVRASGATLEALLFLIAAFCRLAKSLSHSEQMG